MPIRKFLLWLVLAAALLPLAAILANNIAYIGSYPVYLGVILVVGMYVRKVDPAISIPVFFVFLLGFFQRYLFLIVYPIYSDFTILQSRSEFENSEIAAAFLFVFLCLLAMYFGIRLHQFFKSSRLPPLKSYNVQTLLKPFIVYACFSSVLTLYLFVFESVGIQGGEDSSLGFLTRLFDIEAAMFALMFIYVACQGRLSGGQKKATIILLIVYACLAVAKGGRSGLIYIAMVLLFAAVVANKANFVKTKYVTIGAVTLFILGPIYFNLGFILRAYWSQDIDITLAGAAFASSDAFVFLLNNISNRLGELDHLVAIVNHFELNDYTDAVKFYPIIENTLKGFLPSFLFSTESMSLDRVFPYVFRNIPLTLQHAEHWGGFGASFGYFGYAGALVYFFLFGWILDVIVRHFRRYPPDSVMALIFSAVMYNYYSNLYTAYWELLLAALGRFLIIVGIIVALQSVMRSLSAGNNSQVVQR